MKTSKIRMSARDEDCLLGFPNICNGDSSTTVLAHLSCPGISGIGMKPKDICGVYACSSCHDVLDGRSNAHVEGMDGLILEGHLRTLDKLIAKNLVTEK